MKHAPAASNLYPALIVALCFQCSALLAQPAQRIVSINLCTDQLLLLLAGRERIASVSFMAGNPLYSAYADRVGDIPLNHARAEEIVALEPDLVLAYELSDSQLVAFLRQLGYRVEVIAAPHSLAGVENTISAVAGLLGERRAGADMAAKMQRRLDAARERQRGVSPLAVIYSPNGYSPGSKTLQGSVLEAAGFTNLSRQLGNENGASIPLEQLLSHQPDLYIIDDQEPNANSMAQKKLSHPALRRSMASARVASVTGRYWSCPTPELASAVEELQEYLF